MVDSRVEIRLQRTTADQRPWVKAKFALEDLELHRSAQVVLESGFKDFRPEVSLGHCRKPRSDHVRSSPAGHSRPRASFESRYDLGVALVDLLDGLDVAEIQTDAGLWDWLSLCLVDQLCPPDEAGRRKPGQIDRYLLQLENHRTRYRHLVRTAWSLVRVHDSSARFMLAGPLHVHGEAAEQLGAYQDVITCKPLIAAIRSLVWDVDRGKLKRGFGGSGPGSARRVQVVAKQFGLTYDLHSMRPEQILALLPREFDRFRDGPPPRARRRALTVRREEHPEADRV